MRGNLATGEVRQVQKPWADGYKGRRKSTWAETEAIKEVLLECFAAEDAASVLVLTDSGAARGAFHKGRSMVYALNRAILEVAEKRPLLQVRLEFVPGKTNVADDLSRGKAPIEDTKAHADLVRAQAVGFGISFEV